MSRDLTNLEFWDKQYSGIVARKGQLYSLIHNKIHWKYDRMICHMLDSISNKQANVLELGCAPGAIIERVHRLRPHLRLAGIDYSKEGVKITRERLISLGIAADIYCEDLRTVTLPMKYDAAVSFGLIEHFEDPIEILKHHRKFVVSGGLVAVSVPNYSHPFIEKLIKRYNPNVLKSHNLMIMNEKSLAHALETCGLENVSVGGSGGPRLDFQAKNTGLKFCLYNNAARAWNVLTAVFPDMFWHAHIWGIGRVKLER